MKLVQLYFFGVLIMIGLLAASTFWQFQQFQRNFSNLSVALPKEITSKIPDTNSTLTQLLTQSQIQTKTENATTTLEFITPDKKLKLNYPADWQETNNIPLQIKGKILFAAYKNNGEMFTPAINYLIIEEIGDNSMDEIIEQYKKDAKDNNYSIKITSSETINSEQTTNIIKIEYQIIDSEIQFSKRVALVDIAGKIYSIAIVTQGNDQGVKEITETIFDSINTNPE